MKSFRSFVNLQPLPSFATLSQTVVVPVAGKSAFKILAQVTQKEMAAHKEEATAEGEGDEGSKSVEKAKNSTIAALERLLGEDSSEEN